MRLLSSHAKIRKINVNAQKTQVIALKVIKRYSLPCTIKVLIGILYRETQISNKILPWDAALWDHGGNKTISERQTSLGTQETGSRKTILRVVLAYFSWTYLLCFQRSVSHYGQRSMSKQWKSVKTTTGKLRFFTHLNFLPCVSMPKALLHSLLNASILPSPYTVQFQFSALFLHWSPPHLLPITLNSPSSGDPFPFMGLVFFLTSLSPRHNAK